MMETFPMTMFKFTTEYPQSGTSIQLGNSYAFTAAPTAPDQRTFTLTFSVLKYFINGDGSINTSLYSNTLNLKVLEDFYARHKLWKSFNFTHPIHGSLVVKFKEPLSIPAGETGGGGAVKEIQVKLIEQP